MRLDVGNRKKCFLSFKVLTVCLFPVGVLQGGRMRYYEMPGYTDVDIDYPHDWKPAEQRVLKYGYKGKKNRLGVKGVVIDADDVLFDSQVSGKAFAQCARSCARPPTPGYANTYRTCFNFDSFPLNR